MQLITIPFACSHKEISSEEMKSHSQSCKHGCVLLIARRMCKSIIFIHLCLKSFVQVDYVKCTGCNNIYDFCTEHVEKIVGNIDFLCKGRIYLYS